MKIIRKTSKLVIVVLLFAAFILSIIACCRAMNVKAEDGTNIALAETALYGDKNGGNPFIIKNGYVERNGERQEVNNISLIKHGEYFKANPLHSENKDDQNSAGTCTTVAMDLLFGFHNYYSDRRLIPYGYGFLDEEGYGLLKYNPLFDHQCYNKSDLGCRHIGLTDKVHDKLMGLNPFSTSGALGQTQELIVSAADKFLSQYSYKNGSDKFSFGVHTFDRSSVDNQLNSGRPVMLGFSLLMTGNRHQVVAYGSATVDGDYGYIVHSGWYSDNIYDWIPADWCISFATMRSYHNHKYSRIESSDEKDRLIGDTIYCGVRCSECNAVILDRLYENTDVTNDYGNITGTSITGSYRLLNFIEIPDTIDGVSVTEIADGAFGGQSAVQTIHIPTSVYRIGNNAFENCTALREINLDQIRELGEYAFYGCASLQNVVLPEVREINTNTFSGCSSLKSIHSAQAETVGKSAFANCKNLTSISTYRLTNIEDNAFENCTALREINLNHIQKLGAYAFYGCSSLQDIVLPEVRDIKPYTFSGCTGLYGIELNTSDSVGIGAFNGCTGLRTIVIESSPVIDSLAFAGCNALEDVYLYNLSVKAELENDCFPIRDFVVHVPYKFLKEYTEVFAPYTQDVSAIVTTVYYTTLGNTFKTEHVNYGSYIKLLPVRIDGFMFEGWYDNESFRGRKSGETIQVQEYEVLRLYAKQIYQDAIDRFERQLATIADYYVQDAYNSVKSKTLSIVDIPRYYQEREAIYAGALLYKNILFGRDTENPERPYVVMSGNVNTTIENELRYIYDRMNVCNEIYVAGQAARAFYAVRGIEFGNNENLPEETVNFAMELVAMAEHYGVNLVIPGEVYTTNQDMTEMILRRADEIPADEIPLWFNIPDVSNVHDRAKTLEITGYPIICSDATIQALIKTSLVNDFYKMTDEYLASGKSIDDTIRSFTGDRFKVGNADEFNFYSENNDVYNYDEPIFQTLKVGGDTLDDIPAIFDCEDLRDKTVLMRVECNVGDINRCDESKLRECLLNMSPSIRFMGQNGCRNLILMANNRYDPTRWAAKESHEFNNKRLLEMSAQIFGVEEVGFARFGEELEKSVANGRYFDFNIIWTENLYAYETTYDAFPSV